MNTPTDTELLDAAEAGSWDIDAPGDDERSWVIYDKGHALGDGIGSGSSLRMALLRAYLNTRT